jgi:hypothetical protein
VLLSLVYRLVRCLLGLRAVLVRSDLSRDAVLLVLRHDNQVLWHQRLPGRCYVPQTGRITAAAPACPRIQPSVTSLPGHRDASPMPES